MIIRKVSGERVGAAIIDSIIVGIITGIISGIYMFLTIDMIAITEEMMNSGGYDLAAMEELTYQIYPFVSIVGLVFGILYFVVIPTIMNGQTFGKKILSIKAIDEKGNNPKFWQHFLRAIQVWSYYVVGATMILMLVDPMIFYSVSSALDNIVSLLKFASLILIFAMANGRGLHDMLAKTYVVSIYDKLGYAAPQEKYTPVQDWIEEEPVEEQKEEKKDDWGF